MKYINSLFIILLFTGCSHTDPPTPNIPAVNERQMVEECKAWSLFKEGSYWVYKDSATGDIDSLSVYYSNEGETISDGTTYYWFECRLLSSLDSFTYTYWFHSSWTGFEPYRSKVYRIKSKPGDPYGETVALEYPIIPGNVLYTYGNATEQNIIETLPTLPSILIIDTTYTEIACVAQSWDPSEDSPGLYFWCKNVGVVRHEIVNSNRKWNLIRYNTVQ